MKKILPFLIILVLLIADKVNSQIIRNNQRNIKWTGIQKISLAENNVIKFLSFEGCVYTPDNFNIPTYQERLPVDLNVRKATVQLINTLWEDVDENEVKTFGLIEKLSTQININQEIVYEIKKPYLQFQFIPLRKNPLTSKIERLVSFEPLISKVDEGITEGTSHKTYVSNSVLATGNWYKFQISSTGIHKITYGDLQSMGLNLNTFDPRNIRIYGNGGAMLSETAGDFRYDDLVENPIQVIGENDGKFDLTDYILFYGQGPNIWKYNPLKKTFNHQKHSYADHAAYFLTADLGPGKRITTDPLITLLPNQNITSFNDHLYHEVDSLNLILSGREWYGETFDIIKTHSFSFSFPNVKSGSKILFKAKMAARSFNFANNNFTISSNGHNLILSIPPVPNSYASEYANETEDTISFPAASTINTTITFNNPAPTAKGWLNYLELFAIRDLKMTGNQMLFRHTASVSINNISEFKISNATSSLKVWDVTDHVQPRIIPTNFSGSELSFVVKTDSLREFAAHNGNSYLSVTFLKKINNQNLHALPQFEFIIITHPDFKAQADRLANFHRTKENMSVVVVQPEEIYNEFSSGIQDVSAIRDFVKMFYDRAGSDPTKLPKYLLLFGDGSYDMKSRVKKNTNFIPTFQSVYSNLHPAFSFSSDDYFGLLDDNEGHEASGNLDIGIGRFPVSDLNQAKSAVDKVIRYCLPQSNQPQTAFQIPTLSDWRNVVCFVGDDEDSNIHMNQANALAGIIDNGHKSFNVDKIFFDAYPQVSTPGGQKYPAVKEAIRQRVEKGALIINYTGHGGETGWAEETVLEVSDILSWKNKDNLSVFITATCEFSRFDDPKRTSAGEYVFLNDNGGGIALFTTTRLTFSSTNFVINENFLKTAFQNSKNENFRMGDMIRAAKINSGSIVYNRNFVLLGNPALKMAFPKDDVQTLKINNIVVSQVSVPDTMKALAKITIEGIIADNLGAKITNFNGIIYPTVFDKPTEITTLANDQGSYKWSFNLQRNILYKGKASVNQGDFKFSFIVPKDIAYKYDYGKISYYAENGITDAHGYFTNFIIGGFSSNPVVDTQGPSIKLFINDEKFVNGGITDENPFLLAFVEDSNGINTVGNSIGHDIIATMDNISEKSIVLNDYYESNIDDYTSGRIRYPYFDLPDGPHQVKLKVWDVLNNSSENSIDFVVAKSAELALDHVLNYPNPFTTQTQFYFEHNNNSGSLDVQIQIFTISGKLIKTLDNYITTTGNRSGPIPWDGRDDFGDKIGRGVYIYKLKVKTDEGKYCEKLQKLVLLN